MLIHKKKSEKQRPSKGHKALLFHEKDKYGNICIFIHHTAFMRSYSSFASQ